MSENKQSMQYEGLKRLYPIFCKSPKNEMKDIKGKNERKRRFTIGKELQNTPKRPKFPSKQTEVNGDSHKEQLYLDFGQQKFGHVECSECGMIYTNGQLEDTMEHYKYHLAHSKNNSIPFKGWKDERVIDRYDDGRIVLVLPTDSKYHLKKVETIVQVVDKELGYFGSTTHCQIKPRFKSFLFISDHKEVVGYVMAEEVTEAYEMKVLPKSTNTSEERRGEENWSCMSEVSKKVQLGISRVWVNRLHRRKGYASRLLDAARHHYFYAHTVPKDMVAFTDPSIDGRLLAMAYSMSDSVLVYKWSP